MKTHRRKIWCLTGELRGQICTLPLQPGRNLIGSRPGNEIFLNLRGVSRQHAQLLLREGRIIVEDLASKNGTFVNGNRISQAEVQTGDELQICQLRLKIEQIDPPDERLAIQLPRPTSSSNLLRRTSCIPCEPSSSPAECLRHEMRSPDGWVFGSSPAMLHLYQQIQSVAATDLPVLVQGETGVGKEGVARMVHLASPRHQQPFVALNCAAFPAELLEAEWFGIQRGVATGVAPRRGLFERAAGGTLFLDEIGELPTALQSKLLRVLQEKTFRPLGGELSPLDARLVTATNIDFQQHLASGRFRLDLYYRIAGFPLRVPPLRERLEDLPQLVEHFLRQASEQTGKPIRGVSVDALEALIRRSWPGNVRQLENEIQRLCCLCPPHQVLDRRLVEHLPVDLASIPSRTLNGEGIDLTEIEDLTIAQFERRLIGEALRRHGGHRQRAAEALGISRETLRRRLQVLGNRDPLASS